MISRDPFCHSWKRTSRVIREAERRGFEIVFALDQRSCGHCTALVDIVEDDWTVHRFVPPYDACGPVIDEVVHMAKDPMVLLVSDDEEPSPALWDFAQRPNFPGMSWSVRMLTPIPDGQLYALGTEIQVRVIAKANWRWVGGISGYDEHGGKVGASQKILWHYACLAPREYREEKIAAYRRGAPQDPTTPKQGDENWRLFAERHYWEDRPDAVVPLPAVDAAHLPT